MSIIIFIAFIQTVSAIPPIPESYWGYATINGAPAVNGTSITVEVHDTREIIASTTVQYQNGGYSLNIEFDDPNTSEDEGVNEGDKLTWKLGNSICSDPAQGTDIATSIKTNSNFNLVLNSNNDHVSSGGIPSSTLNGGDDFSGASDEALEDILPIVASNRTTAMDTADPNESSGVIPVDKKSAIPGFSLISGVFILLIAVQIIRIRKAL